MEGCIIFQWEGGGVLFQMREELHFFLFKWCSTWGEHWLWWGVSKNIVGCRGHPPPIPPNYGKLCIYTYIYIYVCIYIIYKDIDIDIRYKIIINIYINIFIIILYLIYLLYIYIYICLYIYILILSAFFINVKYIWMSPWIIYMYVYIYIYV